MSRSKGHRKYYWAYLLLTFSMVIFGASFVLRSITKSTLAHETEVLQYAIQDLENDFSQLVQNDSLVMRMIRVNETTDDLAYVCNKPYYFYLYNTVGDKSYLRFWNTANLILPDSILLSNKPEQFSQLANGFYYIKKVELPHAKGITAWLAVLVKSSYYLRNIKNLKESFGLNNKLDGKAEISTIPNPYPVRSSSGNILFYLKQKANQQFAGNSIIGVILKVISLFLIFLSIYFILSRHIGKQHRKVDSMILLICMVAFRAILYIFRGPLRLDEFELFAPNVYGSSFWLHTLGDLLINSLLFSWLCIFFWRKLKLVHFHSLYKHTKYLWLIAGVGTGVLVIATFSTSYVIRTIVADSKISFDVTNFFSLNIYTAIGFIILACLSLGYHYLTRILNWYIFPVYQNKAYIIYLLISIIGLLYISIFVNRGSVDFYLYCLLWLLAYTFVLYNEEKINRFIRVDISGIVVWIFIFSISISALLLAQIKKNEIEHRKLYVEKLATKTDPYTERLIGIANKYLTNDFFKNNYFKLYNGEQNRFIRDSILTANNYARYNRNYNTSLYMFDSLGNSMFNQDSLSLAAWDNVILKKSTPTNSPDLYFYETAYDQFAYITKRVVTDNGKKIGTVFIVSDPIKFSGPPISPELFRQESESQLYNSTVYNYAIYKNKLLVSSSKNYPFTSTLYNKQLPKASFEVRNKNGYSELWYKASNTTVIVMVRKGESVLEAITLFSYIFCAFLLLVSLARLISFIVELVINKRLLRRRFLFASSIRGQIHSTFILITIFSFLVIGFATISFFTKRYHENNADRLGNIMSIMQSELQGYRQLSSLMFEGSDKGLTDSSALDTLLKRVADIHGVDANIYNLSGRLLASSQPDVYLEGVLSTQMDPNAYYHLLRLRQIEHLQQEQVSQLKYTSIYAPLRDQNGSLYAYLSIPYFTSQQQLNQEISRFLVTVINLNAFVFLITGLVALLIANRITRSFTLISDKMKLVNLEKNNEQILWERNDEIGGLVNEYNKMVAKLRTSANLLAQSERQVAWREMARQVAHEIKNPLTPMKLSLQYLQKAIREDRPNVSQLTENVSKTLVEQIDHLSKIAADFSQFANINSADKEIFDLHEAIQPLFDIYSKYPKVDMQWNALPGEVYILADKTQMNRLFTNLLVNAIEACEDRAKCVLKISESITEDWVTISIDDNGPGISEDMHDKIFIPNFTTKSSGTGLGLAMCRGIVEQAGGQIYFTTVLGAGSTFSVKLPLVAS